MNDRPRRGSDRVPPGQYQSKKWPVLTIGETPDIEPSSHQLEITGAVLEPTTISWQRLQSLPRVQVVADFHCVTRFSTLDNQWSGFRTKDVLALARVDPEASHVMAHCTGGYTTNMPLEDLLSEHSLLADQHNGSPLEREHGGPLRLVIPHLYAWKSAKWISALELLRSDRRGFWEENGYHTYGDPWSEQRFSSQETREAHQVRRRARELGIVPSSEEE